MSCIFVILNLKAEKRRLLVMTAVILCLVMSTALVYPKLKRNDSLYQSMKQSYTEEGLAEMEELCRSVPADASVTASSNVAPHLYQVKHLYIIMHTYDKLREKGIENGTAVGTDTDYYVIDTRYDTSELQAQMGNNYELERSAGSLSLYKHR